MPKIKCEIIEDGEHKGWWCASYEGTGVYGVTKDAAVNRLRILLDL